ncbi:DUF2799 domain-containing protein [Teredinibacter sp. KSP-S5-2]|uniref:DUF2799 domain-containing protein n=1 Tax=Teredinibacter sp. KSP-S5-2 TaxID=3034506 RepID=UPI002934ECE6|nr:DUF2799 domain-containing protein [Teredinibacter sp. KSP-S5-2]WNO10330.1 DUF2799 domain-containing protein [Teredinibacter sp. KSP-S5-2]
MLNYIQVALFILGALCANSLFAGNCDEIDWKQRGMEEAQDGNDLNLLRKYKKTCKPKLTQNHVNSYLQGYEAGLFVFCTADNGYDIGLSGKKYNNICPDELEEDFFEGYNKGFASYRVKSRNDDIADDNRRREMERALRRKETSREMGQGK